MKTAVARIQAQLKFRGHTHISSHQVQTILDEIGTEIDPEAQIARAFILLSERYDLQKRPRKK